MKAILVSVRSIDQICHSLGWPAYCFVSTRAGGDAAEYQKAMDQFFEDGFIPEKLICDLDVSPLTEDSWEASFSLLRCDGLDGLRAALCQPLLQWYFVAFVAPESEVNAYAAELKVLIAQSHSAALDELFLAMRLKIPLGTGIQLWSANDVGIGERTSSEIVITGPERLLVAVEERLRSEKNRSFHPSFALGDGSVQWIEL